MVIGSRRGRDEIGYQNLAPWVRDDISHWIIAFNIIGKIMLFFLASRQYFIFQA